MGRFRVVSTTGFGIVLGGSESGSGRNPADTWTVLDTENLYQRVGEFSPTGGGGSRTSAWCERKARRLAQILNQWDEAIAAGLVGSAETLLDEARLWCEGRVRGVSSGVCKACGVPRDEFTPSCDRCRNRHNKRAGKSR